VYCSSWGASEANGDRETISISSRDYGVRSETDRYGRDNCVELPEFGGGVQIIKKVGEYCNTPLRIVCFILLAINVAYAVTGVARYGSQHVDAYGIWLLKAKMIKQTDGALLPFLRDSEYAYSHQTYPILLPWLMTLSDSFLYVYPVLYVAILALLYRVMRNESLSHVVALGWTTLASFMGPLIAQGGRMHAGLADIWITLLVALCMLFAQKKQWWGVVGLVMLASMIKTEGIFLLAFLAIGLPGLTRKCAMCAVAVIPFLIWQIMVRVWGIPSDVVFGWPGFTELFHRLGIVAVGVGKEMMNWRNWYVVWGMVLLRFFFASQIAVLGCLKASGCALNLLEAKKKQGGWGTVLVLMISGYVGVYLLADMNTAAYVSSSVDRIMLQLLPLWWVIMAKNNSLSHRAPFSLTKGDEY